MKFKNNPEISIVETTIIETTIEESQEKIDEKSPKKSSNVLTDLFAHFQQISRTYLCFQLYFEEKKCLNSAEHFRILRNETLRHLQHLFMFFNPNEIPSLDEVSFNFKDDKEPFFISVELEEKTITLLQKILEEVKDDFAMKQWINDFKIYKTLSVVKRLKKQMEDLFCDEMVKIECPYTTLC